MTVCDPQPRNDTPVPQAWCKQRALGQKGIEIEEVTDKKDSLRIIIWIEIDFGRRMGLGDDHAVHFEKLGIAHRAK